MTMVESETKAVVAVLCDHKLQESMERYLEIKVQLVELAKEERKLKDDAIEYMVRVAQSSSARFDVNGRTVDVILSFHGLREYDTDTLQQIKILKKELKRVSKSGVIIRSRIIPVVRIVK